MLGKDSHFSLDLESSSCCMRGKTQPRMFPALINKLRRTESGRRMQLPKLKQHNHFQFRHGYSASLDKVNEFKYVEKIFTASQWR